MVQILLVLGLYFKKNPNAAQGYKKILFSTQSRQVRKVGTQYFSWRSWRTLRAL